MTCRFWAAQVKPILQKLLYTTEAHHLRRGARIRKSLFIGKIEIGKIESNRA